MVGTSKGRFIGTLADSTQAAALCERWKSQIDLGRILLAKARLHASRDATDLAEVDARRALGIPEACGAGYWTEKAVVALREIAPSENREES